MDPHEIQVGILKRLRGTPIIRHTEEYDMRYNQEAPYEILSNNLLDFTTMQKLKRFARYWDIVANSGRFKHSKSFLLGANPFNNFLRLSNWLHAVTDQTHNIALARLFRLLYKFMTEELQLDKNKTTEVLLQDYKMSGIKGHAKFMFSQNKSNRQGKLEKRRSESRQKRHQAK
jgi:hypothetical protein